MTASAEAEEAARLAEMLEAMARAEDGKAEKAKTEVDKERHVTMARLKQAYWFHHTRAGALREAALAVRLGQARREPQP